MSFIADFFRSLWIPSTTDALVQAEGRLLLNCNGSFVSDIPIPFRNVENISIRTLETQWSSDIEGSDNNSKETPLVLCHGYGSGIAGWYRNINALSQYGKLYAIDWIGFGNSSRPLDGPKGLGVEGTEEWFIECLEQWRETQGIEKMHLCGHSLGGYLAVCYAEKYPHRLQSLILESPVGVPDNDGRPDMKEIIQAQPFFRRALLNKIHNLWESGTTPGGVIRKFGPFGKSLMNGYVKKRFQDDVDKKNFADYLYHNSAATQISGELALNELLEVGAYARKPLHQRILQLDPSIPIDFIYGTHDWMDYRHGERVMEESKNTKPKQKINVHVVQNAGHYIHLDCPREFEDLILSVIGRENNKPFSVFS